MRVIEVRRFGGPEVLMPVDVDDPVPGPGEIVVDVAAADVLFLDTVIRRGAGGPHFPLRPPYVPGTGVAGVAADGRRVLVETNGGGYASKVVATSVIDVPPRVGLREAAALLHDGRGRRPRRHRPRYRAGAVRSRRDPPADRAGAGACGPDPPGHRGDVSAGPGRRRARGAGAPRGGRQDAADPVTARLTGGRSL